MEPVSEILLVQCVHYRRRWALTTRHRQDILAQGARGWPDVLHELAGGSGLGQTLPEALPPGQQDWEIQNRRLDSAAEQETSFSSCSQSSGY